LIVQASVSISWVATVLDAAARQGASRAQVLALAGIAEAELQRERWPIDHIARLWRAALQATQDPGFGLKAGASVGPASFNVVSYLLQSAPTLRAALSLVQKYQRLISDGGRFQTVAGDGACWLIYHPHQGSLPFSPHQIEAVLAAVVVFARWVSGQGAALKPLAVQFNQPRIGPLAGYRAVFDCTVEFEQAFSGVLLDNTLLDKPLPQADAQLAQAHHRLAAERLVALALPQALEQTLAQWLAWQLQSGVPTTRTQAARYIGLSERSLARQLQGRGTSFSRLLDAARQAAALQAVAEGGRSLADIGQALGFADASVFQRAFRRWTGETPGRWKKRSIDGHSARIPG